MARPTVYKPEYAKQAEQLIGLGAKDIEIAEFFGVSVKTLHNWRYKHPEFLQSTKLSRTQYSERIERSLAEKALGYSCKETKVFNVNGELKTKSVTKHYAPDVTACIFWLKNRRGEEWRDVQERHNHHTIEREEIDDLDLARKLVYLLSKGEKQLETQH